MPTKLSKLSFTLLITIILMVLHIIEELVTKFWLYDPGILWGARTFHTTSLIIYTLVVVIGLAILIPAFISSLHRDLDAFSRLLVGAIFLVETAQLRNFFPSMSYFPGIISAAALVIVGIYYWPKFLIYRRN